MVRGSRGYITVAVSQQDFSARKLKYSFLALVYPTLFNNAFEAWNSCKKYVAKIQLPGNSIAESSGMA
jgi:hypothetical protein